MSYDRDETVPDGPVAHPYPPSNPRDLWILITVLTIAAIELTNNEGDQFTLEELFARAKDIAGPECPVSDIDLAIVVKGADILRKRKGKYQLK